MISKPETLRRLCFLFFPELPVPSEWCASLGDVLEKEGVDDVEVIAYFHAMFRHHKGLSAENPAVAASVREPFPTLEHFGSEAALVIQAARSDRWIGGLVDFYNTSGIAATFIVDSGTSSRTREALRVTGARHIDIGAVPPGDWFKAVFDAIDADWIFHTYDDEVPTPALLKFADRAVQHSTNFVWGFSRVPCKYNPMSDELQYSQFLPFGPLANARLQWRLVARQEGPKERRSAAASAILLDFDWIARSFAERVNAVRPPAGDSSTASADAFRLHEEIPENWHLWEPLRDKRFEELARAIHRSTAGQT